MARKYSYDPEKVKELRAEVIENCLLVISDDKSVKKWSKYKKEMMLKLSARVLPTLTEHSGIDGKDLPPLQVQFINAKDNNNPNS